jgi:shikimate dehydrogenase
MQEAAFAVLGLPWRYLTMDVAPADLADAIRGVRALGMQGVNLTIPHKVAVLPLLDEVSPDAARIGAVNTVRRDGRRLIGENTDGKGFLRGLRLEAGLDPAGRNVLLLGAGGAARAIAFELAAAGVKRLAIVNRGAERGAALCEDLKRRAGLSARFELWSGVCKVGAEVDILVNCTSIGLFPNVAETPPADLQEARPDLLVCDVVPNPAETGFIKAARARGLRTLTGLPMLVCQGVIGFEMWTGRPAPEAAMRAALAKAFE